MRWPNDAESFDLISYVFTRYRGYGGIRYSIVIGFKDAVESVYLGLISMRKQRSGNTYVSQL